MCYTLPLMAETCKHTARERTFVPYGHRYVEVARLTITWKFTVRHSWLQRGSANVVVVSCDK